MSFSMEIVGEDELKAVVEEQVRPVPEEVVKLKAQAEQNVQTIMEIDLDSLEKRKNILAAVENFGIETMRASSQKNALLQVTIGKLSKSGDEGRDCCERTWGASVANEGSRSKWDRLRQTRVSREVF